MIPANLLGQHLADLQRYSSITGVSRLMLTFKATYDVARHIMK